MTNEDTAWEQFSKAEADSVGDSSAQGMLQAILAELNSVKADTARLAQKIDSAGAEPPMDMGGAPPDMPPEAMGAGMPPEMPPMGGEGLPPEAMPPAPEAAPPAPPAPPMEPPMAPPAPSLKDALIQDGVMAPDVVPQQPEDETLIALQDALSQVTDPMAISKLADIIKEYVGENYGGAEGGAMPPAEAPVADAEMPPEEVIEAIVDEIAGEAPADEGMPLPEEGLEEDIPPEMLDALAKSDEPGAEAPMQGQETIAESDDEKKEEPAIQINLFLGAKIDDIIDDNQKNELTDKDDLPTESFKVCQQPEFKKSIDDLMNERMRLQSGVDGKRYQVRKSRNEQAIDQFYQIQKSISSFDAVKGMRVGDILSSMYALGSRGMKDMEKTYTPLINEMVKYCDNNIGPEYTIPLFKSFGLNLEEIYEPLDESTFKKAEFDDILTLGRMGTAGMPQMGSQELENVKRLIQLDAISRNNRRGKARAMTTLSNIDDKIAGLPGEMSLADKVRKVLSEDHTFSTTFNKNFMKGLSDDQIYNILAAIRGPGKGWVRSDNGADVEAMRQDMREGRRADVLMRNILTKLGDERFGGLDLVKSHRDPRISSVGSNNAKAQLEKDAEMEFNDTLFAFEDLLDYLANGEDETAAAGKDSWTSRRNQYMTDMYGKATRAPNDKYATESELPVGRFYNAYGFDSSHPMALLPGDKEGEMKRAGYNDALQYLVDILSDDTKRGGIEALKGLNSADVADTVKGITAMINGEDVDTPWTEMYTDMDDTLSDDVKASRQNAYNYYKELLGGGLGGYTFGKKVGTNMPAWMAEMFESPTAQGGVETLRFKPEWQKKVDEMDMAGLKDFDDEDVQAFLSGKEESAYPAFRSIVNPQLKELYEKGIIKDPYKISKEEMDLLRSRGKIADVSMPTSTMMDAVTRGQYGLEGDKARENAMRRLAYIATTKDYRPYLMPGASVSAATRALFDESKDTPFKKFNKDQALSFYEKNPYIGVEGRDAEEGKPDEIVKDDDEAETVDV